MAQYFTDFSTDTIGALPANTTLKRNATAGDYTVQTDDSVKVLRYQAPSAATARGLSYDLVPSSGVTEIFAEAKDTSSDLVARLVAFATDSPDSEVGFILRPSTNELEAYRRKDGSFVRLAIVSFTNDATFYKNYRLRVSPGGANQVQVRAWSGTEPSTWNIDAIFASGSQAISSGWTGHVAFAQNATAFFKRIGIGTNGDPAPTSPISSAVPTLSTPTATAVTSNSISFSIPVSY